MRLTSLSAFSLGVLCLGARSERLATIPKIAAACGISENHLMNVVHRLAQDRSVETVRGVCLAAWTIAGLVAKPRALMEGLAIEIH